MCGPAMPEVPLTFLTVAETVARAALWWDGPTPAEHGGSVPRAVAAEAAGASWAPAHRGLTRGAGAGGAARWGCVWCPGR